MSAGTRARRSGGERSGLSTHPIWRTRPLGGRLGSPQTPVGSPSAPSTSRPRSCMTGVNMPGTEADASIATAIGPLEMISVRQRSMLNAVTATGNLGQSSKLVTFCTANFSASVRWIFAP